MRLGGVYLETSPLSLSPKIKRYLCRRLPRCWCWCWLRIVWYLVSYIQLCEFRWEFIVISALWRWTDFGGVTSDYSESWFMIRYCLLEWWMIMLEPMLRRRYLICLVVCSTYDTCWDYEWISESSRVIGFLSFSGGGRNVVYWCLDVLLLYCYFELWGDWRSWFFHHGILLSSLIKASSCSWNKTNCIALALDTLDHQASNTSIRQIMVMRHALWTP